MKLDWEARNIVDILREHHADLIEASVKLSEGGDFEGAYAIDDDIIIIEKLKNL